MKLWIYLRNKYGFLSLNNKEISLRAEDVNAAFADYPFNVQMSEEALLNYLMRNLFDPVFSFVCVKNQKNCRLCLDRQRRIKLL